VYPFEYHRPRTVEEAASLLAECVDARALAGGQSLLPSMRLRLGAPPRLVDLNDIDGLATISVGERELRIGAMTRHAEVAGSAQVARHVPALRALAAGIGDQQIRNLGTLGGSLANNDPAACYPAAALALGATISTNRRRIRCEEFFRALHETCLQPGELITAVSFPLAVSAAYVKFRQPASRFALVGVFVASHPDHVRVAVTGAGAAGVFRAGEIEAALNRSFSRAAVSSIRVDPATLCSDVHASAAYRSHLITVLAGQAVERIRGGGLNEIRGNASVAR
jgi:carbon-monoxide dehydrogenase medium subunit